MQCPFFKIQFAVQEFSQDTLDDVKFKPVGESKEICMQMELWKAKGKIFHKPTGLKQICSTYVYFLAPVFINCNCLRFFL